jgi:hypothetical protein
LLGNVGKLLRMLAHVLAGHNSTCKVIDAHIDLTLLHVVALRQRCSLNSK